MKKGFAAASFLAVATFTLGLVPAHAETISVLAPGQLFPPAGFEVATFDTITQTPYGSQTPTGTFVDGGATFSGTGVVMNNDCTPSGCLGSLGLYAEPAGDLTNYLAVIGGGNETISYPSLHNVFGLYWGSVDAYNHLQFFDGSTLVATVSGPDVVQLIDDGNQQLFSSNSYVIISGLPSFNAVLVTSDSNSFEFDNVATTPLPSTWTMLIAGFFGLGFFAYRGSNRSTAIATA